MIDEDLGPFGDRDVDPGGVKNLIANVGLGKVGIILGIEVSRWHPATRTPRVHELRPVARRVGGNSGGLKALAIPEDVRS